MLFCCRKWRASNGLSASSRMLASPGLSRRSLAAPFKTTPVFRVLKFHPGTRRFWEGRRFHPWKYIWTLLAGDGRVCIPDSNLEAQNEPRLKPLNMLIKQNKRCFKALKGARRVLFKPNLENVKLVCCLNVHNFTFMLMIPVDR